MNGVKRALVGCGLILALAAATPASAQATRVGVFNAQAVSENTEMGKRVQAELTAFTEGKESEIAARQQKVAGMRDRLTQQALSLSSDKRAALEKDIQLQALDLQSFQEAATRELELEYQSATREFQEKLIATIETFGADEGFTIILDRSQVAWAHATTDVTSALIDRFNAMFPVTPAGQ